MARPNRRPAGVRAQARIVVEPPSNMPRRGSSDGPNRVLAQAMRSQLFPKRQLDGDSSAAANVHRFKKRPPVQ